MDINEYLKKKSELENAMKSEGKTIIRDFLKQFMDENPEVTAVRWHQYTPYFNDGDACVFSVGEPYISTKSFDEAAMEENPDESENWMSSYEFKSNKAVGKKLKENFLKFSNAIEGILSDLLQTAFGDHVQVIVTKEDTGKIVIRIENYQHD